LTCGAFAQLAAATIAWLLAVAVRIGISPRRV